MRAPTRPSAAAAAVLVLMLCVAQGCSESRTFTIYSTPGDARLVVDGVDRGPGPITQRFTFSGSGDAVRVRATREGYKPASQTLSADTPGQVVVLRLEPLGPKAVVTVQPAAMVRIDGRLVSTSPVTQTEVPLDASRPDKTYTVTAEAPGYAREQLTLRATSPQGYYRMTLRPVRPQDTAVAQNGTLRPRQPAPQPPTTRESSPQVPATRPAPQVARGDAPLRRTITIRTDPPVPGAEIFVAGEKRGDREVELTDHPFQRDAATGRSVPQTVTASAPGFRGGEATLRYEDNTSVYVIPLGDRRKEVRIASEPPGAIVTLDGKELPRDREGVSSTVLSFPPTDPPGQPTRYAATVKAGDPSAPYEPAQLGIGWDDGRRDYAVRLPPSLVVKVSMVRAVPVWEQPGGWRATARREQTVAARDTSEGPGNTAQHVAEVAGGGMLDSVIASPDGSQVLVTELLAPDGAGPLRSRMRLLNSDGSPGPALPSDGRHFDAMPSFTPDGGEIIFTSDRAAQGLDVWSMKVAEGGAVRQLARGGEKAGLWPMIDASPRRRLFYEAMLKPLARPSEGRSEVHVVELEADPPTNKALSPGTRPRASPRADAVVFTRADPASGKRDIYMISDKDGASLNSSAVNLTNTPDVDECDPAWSRTGGKIAYASEAGNDPATGRNHDLYVLAVSDPKQKVRVTRNGSWDDSPAWDPTGRELYFRSNRGGKWAVWKVAVP
jgi:hypothetical protein